MSRFEFILSLADELKAEQEKQTASAIKQRRDELYNDAAQRKKFPALRKGKGLTSNGQNINRRGGQSVLDPFVELIKQGVADGLPFRKIADLIAAQGVTVWPSTIKNYCIKKGIK